MTDLPSEARWLEKLAEALPGVAGYRAKEARRDSDKRLREFLARRLDDCVSQIEDAREAHFKDKGLAGLDAYGRLLQNLRGLADALRFASYGYSGFFDQPQVREAELGRLYDYDLSLYADVRALEIASSPQGGEGLKELAARVEALRRRLEARKDLLERFPRTL